MSKKTLQAMQKKHPEAYGQTSGVQTIVSMTPNNDSRMSAHFCRLTLS